MDIQVKAGDALREVTPVLVVGCCEGEPAGPICREVDAALGGVLAGAYESRTFTGKPNQTLLVHTLGRIQAERVLFVGLGKRRDLTPERVRQAAGSAARALRLPGITGYCTLLHHAGENAPTFVQATVEGSLLGGYAFEQYKTKQDEIVPDAHVTLLFPDQEAAAQAEGALREGRAVAEATRFARDLVNQPGNVATPSYLAEQALELAGKFGLACRILEREELERLGMEGLLAVGKGSRQPPKFIILEYRGAEAQRRPTVLVGKGVTFDSGGISLKPREGMERMKDDMAGAAAVLGTLRAAAALGLPVNLVGLVPAAENMPDGGAYKPGDLIRTMAGLTVEIVNTDAEGRMLLCDALHYARHYKPVALIDLATLTGACLVALGTCASGLLGNDPGLLRALKAAGETCGERLWELPLWEEYGELMKSDIADLKNAGGPHAGTISAAWFLRQFADTARWAHLDIAGTAWEEKGKHYLPKGATGVGVRLLVEYLKRVP